MQIKKTWMFSLKFEVSSWCQILHMLQSKTTQDSMSVEIENIYHDTYFFQLLNMVSTEVKAESMVTVLLPSHQDELQRLLLVSMLLLHMNEYKGDI